MYGVWALLPEPVVRCDLVTSNPQLLFSAGDILAAVMIARLLSRMNAPEPSILLATAAWLYNPYTLTISTRGSCDVLAVLLLLGMLQLLMARRVALAALTYGLVVHLRIYPIIFAPTLVFFLATRSLAVSLARQLVLLLLHHSTCRIPSVQCRSVRTVQGEAHQRLCDTCCNVDPPPPLSLATGQTLGTAANGRCRQGTARARRTA